jgi:hypothetical protein
MKYTTKFNLFIVLILLTSSAFSQTCKTESQIPSTTPDSRFTDNGDGTILDIGTNLMWQKCIVGATGVNCLATNGTGYDWQGALNEAQTSNFAGYNDWRVPNIKEIASIIEHRCKNPALNSNYFPNTPNNFEWSSTPSAANALRTWNMVMADGFTNQVGSRNAFGFVRLVRTGQ